MPEQTRGSQWIWPKNQLRILMSFFLFMTVSVSHASEFVTCGEKNPNNNDIDLSEPAEPGPFHDLTTSELTQLREFLEQDPAIKAVDPAVATMSSSFIFVVDLFLAKKSDILKHLDNNGPRPPRRARVVMFRGDKAPPVVEEYVCGPLPNVQRCDLLNLPSRRNPVEFAFRPFSDIEYLGLEQYILTDIDRRAGHILQESYGATFTNCEKRDDCLCYVTSPLGSGITKDPQRRLTWFEAAYTIPFRTVQVLDFSILAETGSANPAEWSVVKIWYGNRLFESVDDLVSKYNIGSINKTKVTKPVNDDNLYSTLNRRGEPQPPNPQRPPTLVEPDGKRYSVKNRQVKYLGWEFNFRSSDLTGPGIYDVRFKGERMAFEVSLSEIAVVYTAHAPAGQTINYADSGSRSLGFASRTLVPGADCPDTSTLISNSFMSKTQREPDVAKAGFCLFENNNGYPLRRHLAYAYPTGPFYGGMADSALILRSALTIGNYDYIVDYIFHQHGVLSTRFISTGYIVTVFYTEQETPYGFHIQENIVGQLHHHLSIFKVDLDVGGTSNTYTSLDITQERTKLTAFPDVSYSKLRFQAKVKATEQEAVLNYDFNKPKLLVVHNSAKKTNYQELKGYRIQLNGMCKSILDEDEGHEPSLSWGRHQMVVTRHKDDEISASSIYAMYDSYNPVVNFTSFYGDNENIIDKDLVLWITNGMYHLPRTEDLPVTTTVGNHLTFFIFPFNYHPECPSMGSRDAIYVGLKNATEPEEGVKVDRYGNSRSQCLIQQPNLEEDVEQDPSMILRV